MKKILLVAPTSPLTGGVAANTRQLLKSRRFRRQVIHLDISDSRSIANQGRIDLINIWLGFWHPLKVFLALVKNHQEIKAVYLILPGGLLGLIRFGFFILTVKLFNKKIIARYCTKYLFRQTYDRLSFLGRGIVRALLNQIDLLIIRWPDIYQTDFESLFPKKKIRVIPGGIEIDLYRPRKGQLSDRFSSFEIRLIFIGALVKEKGIDELISVFKDLRREQSNIYLEILGDKQTAESRLVKREIDFPSPGFNFRGIIVGKEKISLLQTSDIFVLPSHREAMSRSILEALAAGLPIVTADRGAAQFFIKNGQNGFIIPAGDKKALKKVLLELIERPELREKMAGNNLALAKNFEIRKEIDKKLEIFDQID